MRKVYLIVFGAVLVAAACKSKQRLPEGILPRQQMQEIIWDLTSAGEFLNGFVFSRNLNMDKLPMNEKWYEKVYS
ncbi:MAG: hypothetical protein EOO88_61920, partial [Pedobacter sp.]